MTEAIKNRSAFHDYSIESTIEAGIVLTGAEVKSIRLGQANWTGGYAAIDKKKLFVYGLHIDPYKHDSARGSDSFVYNPTAPRALLVKKKEMHHLAVSTQAEGYTIVPLKLYFKGALIKVELGLGKGKKKFDKRADLKRKVEKREEERYFKYGK